MDASTSGLLVLAVIMVAGFSAGSLVKKLHLPSVTGQILVGFLLAQSGIELFSKESLNGLKPITHFALGLVAVTVGNHLNFRKLRNAGRRLLWLILAEIMIVPTLVMLGCYFVFISPLTDVEIFAGHFWVLALLLGTMALDTAPATTIAIVKETRSKGVFVKTLIAGVALNNMACICLFEIGHSIAQTTLTSGSSIIVSDLFLGASKQLGYAAGIGCVNGFFLYLLSRRFVRSDVLTTMSFIAILFTVGLADMMGVSSLLACIFLGITLTNLAPAKDYLGHAAFSDFEGAIMAVFFCLAGAKLEFSYLLPVGFPVLAFICARLLGKFLAARTAMSIAGATDKMRQFLGLAMLPQAGISIALILIVQEDPALEPISQLFLAIGLSVVTINEIIGPISARYALKQSGDLDRDRPRLIDFLHEENITTDFEAATKEEAIDKLTDLLIRTHRLDVDQAQLQKTILHNEDEMSTCIGEGLAIPYGVLPVGKGDEIVGVMGISRRGIPLATPDGLPVHCMVLIATPSTKREHHLEVLAAFARAIVSNRDIQRQLYSAHSPAHAYEILHADESESYNYFIESEVG